MRTILIDALAARYGGAAYAAVQLARRLARKREVATVIVATRAGSIVARELAGVQGVRCITLPAAGRGELLRRLAWEALGLPRLSEREEVDAVVSMSGMLPRRLSPALICLLFNPVMYERGGIANRLRRYAVRRTSRDALLVAAPSQLMADLASAAIGRTCEIVPLGVDHEVFHPVGERGDELLYVADFYAHKRHDLVLDAWLLLPAPRPILRLVGDPAVDRPSYMRLMRRIGEISDPEAVVVEHRISVDRLVAAYHRARAFVMASEHESFCMPLVESMACGVPPVARDLASLRETGRDGATYVEGDDPAEWAAAIGDLLDSDEHHRRARERAVSVAASYSWESLADAVLGARK